MSNTGATRASLAAILEEAAAVGDLPRALELIQEGALVTPDALCLAVARGATDVVVALLDAGANPNAPDRHGVAPIFIAAAAGHPAVHAYLADPDRTDLRGGPWPEHTASIGHGEIIWTLASRGADASARHAPHSRQTASGTTALMTAAAFGHTGALDVLIAHQADARTTDYAGRTARDWAEHFGQKAAMERLKQFTRR